MNLSEMQKKSNELYILRGYIADLPTLGLGLCEEAGEVAKAINLLNPLYKKSIGREHHDLEHELCDLLIYVSHIANKENINLDEAMEKKLWMKFASGILLK
jgi:NTP pyrophosphatase (non-canonical NTP hydrolase)